jgi:hypothetical protein
VATVTISEEPDRTRADAHRGEAGRGRGLRDGQTDVVGMIRPLRAQLNG